MERLWSRIYIGNLSLAPLPHRGRGWGLGAPVAVKIGYAIVTMALYHFSEEATIARFVPRPPLARPEVEPLVWAIDDWHAPVYFLPRDCPRVCFWPLPTTTAEDHARYFATVSGRMVIAIESGWLERLRTTRLYRYLMPEATFVDIHDHGVHVSHAAVVPLQVEPVGDLLAALAGAAVEVRIMPSLVPLGRAISQTTLHFSLIRMRNAARVDGPGAGDEYGETWQDDTDPAPQLRRS